MKPRVLFVEDETSISGPFSSALTREGFDPVVCGTLGEARAALGRGAFDLVLLDLMLPDGDGRDLARELRATGSEVPIIILTARGTELERVVGLELGADDYVVKPFSGAEVIARMRAVLRRVKPLRRSAVDGRRGRAAAGRARRRGARSWTATSWRLSRKEFDLLAELVSHAGEVVTREDLISRVWDENWFGSTKTLDVHVGWLRGKLGDDASDPRLAAHRARRRLPLHRAGGMGVLTLRARLVLALAYVLVLAIGSMLVPLVRTVRDRVNAEVETQALSQAEVVAATAPAGRGDLTRWSRRRRARSAGGW